MQNSIPARAADSSVPEVSIMLLRFRALAKTWAPPHLTSEQQSFAVALVDDADLLDQ